MEIRVESTLALGIGGLVATTVTAVTGLYFSYKARTSAYQQRLHDQQMTVIAEIVEVCQALHQDLGQLLGVQDDIGRHDRLWHEIVAIHGRLLSLAPRATAYLPSDLFEAYGFVCNGTTVLLEEIAKYELPPDSRKYLEGPLDSFVRRARARLGVDYLSDENARLFKTLTHKNRALPVEPPGFLRATKPNP